MKAAKTETDRSSASEPKMVGNPTLRSRGWTPLLIEQFLPEPDKLAPNPHYRSGPPRKLYLESRVAEIEATDRFRIAARKAGRRKTAARKAVQTKLWTMEQYVAKLVVDVPLVERGELIQAACDHYNARRSPRTDGDDGFCAATPESDHSFLDRIAVNFIRHRLTRYEDRLIEIYGKVGTETAYCRIKYKVLGAIAAAYPDLAPECHRQMVREPLT